MELDKNYDKTCWKASFAANFLFLFLCAHISEHPRPLDEFHDFVN